VIYRRRASALHATRAAAGCAYCAALATVAVTSAHPLVLGAALAAVAGAGMIAGVGREMAWGARLGLALAVALVAVNALVSRAGLTVVARLGELPVLGRIDVTAEAIAYGAVQGLRALVVVECFVLYSAAVDPDEVLRLFRRVSLRSALTASLATRMAPVLARDGRRMAEAQRSLAAGRAPRGAVLRAVTAGALDRSLDVAAALEVRGYGSVRRPPPDRRPWSRHDLAFAGCSLALVAIAAGARLAGVAHFDAYPTIALAAGAPELALAAVVFVLALAPFLARRGIAR
jgi:energy-coupling factor transport system permease protein